VLFIKNNYKNVLPLVFVSLAMIAIVFSQHNYWPLQPLWQTYLAVYFSQLIFWIILLSWNNNIFIDENKRIKWLITKAFWIGFIWSVVQIFWLKQWWTWLNLLSQPFVYALVGYVLIKIFKLTIDQFNKIRHYNDAKYEIEKD